MSAAFDRVKSQSHLEAALDLAHTGSFKRAQEEFALAVQADPSWEKPWSKCLEMLTDLGESGEALAWLLRLSEQPPEASPPLVSVLYDLLCSKDGYRDRSHLIRVAKLSDDVADKIEESEPAMAGHIRKIVSDYARTLWNNQEIRIKELEASGDYDASKIPKSG